MNSLEFDTSQKGFHSVLKDWQLKSMQVVWSSPEGANSRTVWMKVNEMLKTETISRASIINFLEDMREMKVLKGIEKTGKGGHHWVYSPAMDETGFKKFVAETLLKSLLESFPTEMKEVLKRTT